jgi:hypothetical protein
MIGSALAVGMRRAAEDVACGVAYPSDVVRRAQFDG